MDDRPFHTLSNDECFSIGDQRIHEKKRLEARKKWRNPLPRTTLTTFRVYETNPTAFLCEFLIGAYEAPWPIVHQNSTLGEAMPVPYQAYGKVLAEFVMSVMEKSLETTETFFNKFEYMLLFLCQKDVKVQDFFNALFRSQKEDELAHMVQLAVNYKLENEHLSLPELLFFVPLEFLKNMIQCVLEKKLKNKPKL